MRASQSPELGGPSAAPTADKAGCSGQQASSAPSEEQLQRERERVARVLHDTICQDLTGFHYLASALAAQCQTSSPEAAEKLQVLAERIQLAGRKLGDFMQTLRVGEAPEVVPLVDPDAT